ncbi:hypothetical protein [Nocardioides insulae]|uniref:hypothetical protein n=1 Tax=Nocardioides insulae TaxID=394734 RepID=UPI000423A96E|nr:hypothetical protein [Nocardioides insulae]
MPSYMVDSVRQPFTATGIVDAVMEWEESPEGKRRPSKDKQARNEDTGMPLWQVEVLYVQTSFGRRSTVTAKVQVEAQEEPKLRPLGPVGFEGLQVEVRINRAGGFAEYWSAEGLLTAPREAQKPAGEKAA